MSQGNNISSLLSNLDQLNTQNQRPIYIPSLDREVNFKLLTAAQHKHILTTIMDQSNAGISLSLLLNQIIKDNASEKIQINSLDKNYILIALRAYSLSNIYERDNTKADLLDVLNNKLPVAILPIEIKENTFTIGITSPTLDKDSQINRESKRKIEEVKSESNVSKVALDEIYTNEFIKYINYIEFQVEDITTTITFSDLSHAQKRSIVDKLPALTTTKLLTEINKFKDLSEQFLKIDNTKIVVSFDQAFFTI